MLKLYNTCILPIFLYGSAGMDTGRVDPRVGSGRVGSKFLECIIFYLFVSRLK